MTIISFLIIFTYLLYIVLKFGIPRSISQTYYLVNHKWVFSAVLLSSTALILPVMLEMEYSHLAFLGLGGILFVAAAPNFMESELVDSVHTWSAIFAFIFSQIWVAITNPYILIVWILFLIFAIKNKHNYKFYAEIIMLLTIYLTLWI